MAAHVFLRTLRRLFHGRTRALLSTDGRPPGNVSQGSVNICLLNRDGKPLWMSGRVGETLLNVVMNANGPVEGYGACEGTLACTTCHVYLPSEAFERMCQPTEDELDMLDLAVGLAETSRLGCQVVLEPWMDGMKVKVPKHTADLRGLAEDGKMEG
uniref:adrenodoxin-like isoform X2 n=1 Tax=Myxine glutinosa TaxID=7769 RepID=UPI003590004E